MYPPGDPQLLGVVTDLRKRRTCAPNVHCSMLAVEHDGGRLHRRGSKEGDSPTILPTEPLWHRAGRTRFSFSTARQGGHFMHPHLLHPHRTTRSRRWFLLAVVTVSALAVAVGAALGSPTKSHATTLTALIGSSGPAETFAVNGAVKAFTKQTGIEVNVIVASDFNQQLAQGFASGNPPDIFNLSNDVSRRTRRRASSPRSTNSRTSRPSIRASARRTRTRATCMRRRRTSRRSPS